MTMRIYLKQNWPSVVLIAAVVLTLVCWSFISTVFDQLVTVRGLLFLILITLWVRPSRKRS